MTSTQEGGMRINPAPTHVYELDVAGTTLVFIDEDQLRQARSFFASTLRPSDRGGNPPYEHYWHAWYARLPKALLKGSRREQIVRALEQVLAELH